MAGREIIWMPWGHQKLNLTIVGTNEGRGVVTRPGHSTVQSGAYPAQNSGLKYGAVQSH